MSSAPSPKSAVSQAKYATNATPHPTGGNHVTASNSWQWRLRYVANALQFVIFFGAVLYMYGQWAYYHAVYITITNTIKGWCGVPLTGKAPATAHPEMVRPTYFIVLTTLPVFVSVLAWEFLRNFNLRRITSPYIMKLMLILRRKPSLPGGRFVSHLSYGELFYVLVILIGGNIFVFGYRYDSRYQRAVVAAKAKNTTVTYDQKLGVAAQTFGFNAIFNVSLLFWPATRNCVWMEFLNISYANGIKYHRWLGVSAVVSALLHMSCYHSLWVRQGIWIKQAVPCFGCDIGVNNRRWQTTFGELAFIVFLIISVTSLPIVRRKFYNVFYYAHQLFFLAVVFIVIHYQATIWWMMPSILVYFVNRALSSVHATLPVKVKEFTAISHDLVKIVLRNDASQGTNYKVGQFLYLNVPAISKLQWHPFTIASSPQANPKTVTVVLKALGDWTSDLVTHAQECKEKNVLPTVYVDGFYGSSLDFYDEYSTVCLVAGGIGATPIFSILEDLVAKLTANQTIQQRVVFIYSFRELALLEEIHPVLKKLRQLDPEEQYFKTHFYLTRVPTEEDLNTKLRAETSTAIGPSRYDNETTAGKAITFHEPIRPWWLRALAWVGAFLFSVLVVVALEYGPKNGKINAKNAKYWPQQRFVEILIMYIAAMLVGGLAVAERFYKRHLAQLNEAKDSIVLPGGVMPDVVVPSTFTHRDLVAMYNMVVGQRPDMEVLIAKSFEFHTTSTVATSGRPVIGTFVSGPEAMKRSVECAVAQIGVAHFDIHTEEFQL